MPEHTGGVTEARVREIAQDLAEDIAEKAARKAVKETLALLRLYVDDNTSIDGFVDNMRFVAEIRKTKGAIGAAAGASVLDLLKGTIRYGLLAGICWAAGSLGAHYPILTPPVLPAIVGARQ